MRHLARRAVADAGVDARDLGRPETRAAELAAADHLAGGGGAGGDWGQRVGSEYYMSNLDADNMHILLHEIGHSFGLDDFYDWTPSGVCCFLMKAGSASQITEFDAWMFRDWWRVRLTGGCVRASAGTRTSSWLVPER
ncbi:hypothetical protein WBK31_17305 [Nonomuraea sp. N2-4H]|uniref:hypothetical protein n=1 Tax=Nonomuraea sp. N2-4H TaxID=3128898 RepID=UPI00325628EC